MQSNLKHCWLDQNTMFKVDVVRTNGDIHVPALENTLIVAQNLVKLLDLNLSDKPFYFVSKLDNQLHKNGVDEKSLLESTDESSYINTVVDNNDNSTLMKDESVIGSPLKLKEIADLAPLSPSSPLFLKEGLAKGLDVSSQIPLQEARLVLQKFLKTEKDQREPMLAVLCNVQDVKKTLMIGACKESEEDQTVTTFLLTMQKVQLSFLEEPSFWNHESKKYQMESTYDLLDSELGLGTVRLRAKWEDMKGSLKISKPLSTEFCLEWNTTTGNQQSPVYAIHRQLQKVILFLNVLRKDSDVDQVFPERENIISNATSKLKEFFLRKKEGDIAPKSLLGVLDAGNSRLNLNPAIDWDFTDELWGILSCCSGLEEMVYCIRQIFDEMGRGQVHVFVSSDNCSTIANLSRAAASGLAVFPPLNDTQLALRLITEIGVEKLRKLYQALMVTANKLCSPAQWEKLFRQENSNVRSVQGEESQEINALSKQLCVLQQLHACLECVAIMGSFTDYLDLTKIANVVLSSGEFTSGRFHKMKVNPALALPEIDKRLWTSVQRKVVSNELTIIENFCRYMPEGILETPCGSDCVWQFTSKKYKHLNH